MSSGLAVPLQVASLESGESHLHSFNMHPAQLTREGGFIFKITAYTPDGSKCLLHLTDRRIIIEPEKTNIIQDLIRQRFNSPNLAAAQWARTFLQKTDDWGYWSIPYDAIQAVESFTQVISTFARIRLKDHPAENDIIFTTQSGLMINTKEFLNSVRNLLTPLEKQNQQIQTVQSDMQKPAIAPNDREQRRIIDAQRFARLSVSEIKLKNEQALIEARMQGNIYGRLRKEIDKFRELYDKKFGSSLTDNRDYFHEELINSLAQGDLSKMGSDYPKPTILNTTPDREADKPPRPTGTTTFYLKGYTNAKVVSLAGNFNNWSSTETFMARDGDGWICRVDLKPGKYQYKFLVDGNWVNDAENPNTQTDANGNINSTLTIV